MAKIIVVDDTPLMLELICEVLEIMGHETVSLTSAKDALASLDEGCEVDMLVTDYKMPEMNGYELVRFLRETDPWKTLPIIVLSGGSDDHEMDGIMECQPINHLEKPVSPSLLSKTIQDMLDGPSQMA